MTPTLVRFLCLGLGLKAVSALTPDIRADTNRDGTVDLEGNSDSDNKAYWSSQRGAIFLPNVGDKTLRCATVDGQGNPLSNDELKSCHDASGHLLLAPEFIAPLRTLPVDVSDEAVAYVYATPKEAYERVRIFVLDDPASPNITTSWRLVDQEMFFNSTQLSAGLTLGIDGRELVTDALVWDGSVTVKFDVIDGNTTASDAVALKMAPVLTHNHLQAVETVLSTASNETDMIQVQFVEQLEDRLVDAGIENLLLFNQSSDIWAQDFIEPAYASMPGPNGPIALRIMLRSAQATRTGGRQIFEQLRGPGIGGFQPPSNTDSGFGHREINSFGNLETIPPYVSKSGVQYKAGRVIMGKHFERLPAEAMLGFLWGQGLQKPLLLETGWLTVGHVDEFVQFLPYENELGFTIAIADTNAGIEVLKSVRDEGFGDVQATSFELNESPGDFEPEEPALSMTVNDVLANETFAAINAYAQRHIEANLEILLSEIPLDREDVIRVPTLYRNGGSLWDPGHDAGLPPHTTPLMQGEYQVGAFLPASINGVVLEHYYISPKPWGPVVNGQDKLAEAVEAAYAKAGMTVGYIDDYLSHHVFSGEVHCGTNTLRQTDVVWWM